MLHRTYLVIFFITISSAVAQNNWDLNSLRESKHTSGSLLLQIAKDLLQRSASTTQILNLNLSSMLLLLTLKAIVFGAGALGKYNTFDARNLNEENVISEEEAALAVGYLVGDTCLYRAACEVPHTANEYLGAAEMIIQAIELMPQIPKVDEKYEKKLAKFRKAIEYGSIGQCPLEYKCKKESIDRFLQLQ